MFSNQSLNTLHNEQITTKLDKIRETLSRARAGENRKSQYGNWYYPLYPTHINQFIPTLKARGKQTSIILPEFWEVMTSLILENSDKAFEAFKSTINSIESQATYFVKHELYKGLLSKQPRSSNNKSRIKPLYFFLTTTQFECATYFDQAHQFVNVAKKQKAQRYLDVIYTKVREINNLNDYHSEDKDLGPVRSLTFWQELCMQNLANDDDSVSVSINSETPVKIPKVVAADRPTSIQSELTDATYSPSANPHKALAAQSSNTPPNPKNSTRLSSSPAVKKVGAMLSARIYEEASSQQNSPARSNLTSSSALYQSPEKKIDTNTFALSSGKKNITLRPHQRRIKTDTKKQKEAKPTTPAMFRTP